MIMIGNPVLCPLREQLLRGGQIICFVQTDHVVRYWLGEGPGDVSFLAAECRAEDGTRFWFGRLRYRVDDNVIHGTSKDRKEVTQVACGSDVPDDVWTTAVATVLRASADGGPLAEIVEIPVAGSLERFLDLLTNVSPELGHRIGVTQFEIEDPEVTP